MISSLVFGIWFNTLSVLLELFESKGQACCSGIYLPSVEWERQYTWMHCGNCYGIIPKMIRLFLLRI